MSLTYHVIDSDMVKTYIPDDLRGNIIDLLFDAPAPILIEGRRKDEH